MIKHFEIDSFKSLRSVKLDLGNINVFVGPNGVGKTNILEAIGMASKAADASEGVLYALLLLVLCLSEKGPRIFSVDNIDSALNPRLVKALLRQIQLWMKDIIPEKQMFCTVHNPVALDSFDFTDEQVRLFVIDRNSDGLTSVRQIKINEQLLNISKEKHMPLSQLWIDGYIGGVPDV